MNRLLSAALLVSVCLMPGITRAASLTVTGTATKPYVTTSSYKALDNATRDMNGMTVNYVTMGVSRAGIIIGTIPTATKPQVCSSNILIDHTNFTLTKPTTGSNLPVGFSVICGNNITIQNSTASNFKMVEVPGVYTNGDGQSSEKKVTNLTVRNVVNTNASDGCFDNKASSMLLDRNTAIGCHYGYRIWGQQVHGTTNTCQGVVTCVQFAPGADDVALDNLIIIPTAATQIVFDIRKGVGSTKPIVVKHCEVQDGSGHVVTTGLELTWASYQDGATAANTPGIVLDPSCSNSPPVSAPTPPPVKSAVQVFSPTALPDKSGNGSILVSTTTIWRAMGLSRPATLLTPPTPCTNDKHVSGFCYGVKP